jgi:hypothetical protein
VHDEEHVGGQHGGECPEVHSEGIDQGQAVTPGHLQQRHLRVVGALAVELGVDGDAALLEQDADEVDQLRLCLDRCRCRSIGAADDPSGPASSSASQLPDPPDTGKPAATQASVPPATFTASIPRTLRNSAAARLRPPLAQMT